VVESSLDQNNWLVICGRWNPEGRPGGRNNLNTFYYIQAMKVILDEINRE
jgi:hypothetical protein